jgi:hypothetical protein
MWAELWVEILGTTSSNLPWRRASVDMNHRPRPYQSSPNMLYNNLQDRGDCQNTRKSHETSGFVGWIVG